MKLAIISDIHANLEALQACLQVISEKNVDQIVVLGDVVGYNANPSECIALVKERGALCVAGNHDRAVAGLISTEEFSAKAAHAIRWTQRQLSPEAMAFLSMLPLEITLENYFVGVHGGLLAHGGCEITRLNSTERRKVSYEALISHRSGARICGFGNTHKVGIFEWRDGSETVLLDDEVQLRRDCYYLVNPGSVGQPRQEDRRATFLMFDTKDHAMTIRRVSYDFMRPVAKACDAGLLPFHSKLPPSIRRPVRRAANAIGLRPVGERLSSFRWRKR